MSNQKTEQNETIENQNLFYSKLKSRKLWITLLIVVLASVFKYLDKLSDFYFILMILISSGIYIFIEGSIDVKRLVIESDFLKIKTNGSSNGKLKTDQNKES